jgi:hypothetical protein
MRFEHDGMALWFGTPDAPSPAGVVTEHQEVKVLVGVAPADASNVVTVWYRINNGPSNPVRARWVSGRGNTQYYGAKLPLLRDGDTVEYTADCTCVSRHVPSPDEAKQFSTPFRVVEAEAKRTSGAGSKHLTGKFATQSTQVAENAASPGKGIRNVPSVDPSPTAGQETNVAPSPTPWPSASADALKSIRLDPDKLGDSVLDHLTAGGSNKAVINEALNVALRSKLSAALTGNAPSVVAKLTQAMEPVNIAANKDISVRSMVAGHAGRSLKDDSSLRLAVTEAAARLPDTETVGTLLGLDQSVKDHPLFQQVVRNEAQKAELSRVGA